MRSTSNIQTVAGAFAVVALILTATGFMEGFGSLRNLQAAVPVALIAIFLLLWDRFSRDE